MSSVGLLFVGAALLVNGVMLLGHVDARTAGVLNLFVGALQVAIPFWVIATADSPDVVLGAAGVFMFGFTYLYVGINNLAGLDGNGLGWFSAWVSVMAVGFGVTSFVRFDDPATGLLWLQWSVLWGLFFVVIGLGRGEWTRTTGLLTVVQSVTTCTVPGFVALLVYAVPVWVVAATIVLSVVVVAPSVLRVLQDRGRSGVADDLGAEAPTAPRVAVPAG